MFAISNSQKQNTATRPQISSFRNIHLSKSPTIARHSTEDSQIMKNSNGLKSDALWMGLNDTKQVKTLDGNTINRRLIFLDATASPLAYKPIQDEVQDFLTHSYANSHTQGHWRGRSATDTLDAARHAVGTWLGYDQQQDVVIFDGSGATGPANFLAQVLFPKTLRILSNPQLDESSKTAIFNTLDLDQQQIAKEMLEKPWVITTEMEHHANQLPWFDMKNVLIVPVDQTSGELDMEVLQGYMVGVKIGRVQNG